MSLSAVCYHEHILSMKVLIVEDQLRLGQVIKQGLTESRYTVSLARNCEEASDFIFDNSYDAIVLDLGLPDGDGLDLLRKWRQSGLTVPVVILSARDSVQDRIRGLDIGADDYLPKPFSLEELQARIRSLVRRQSTIKTTQLRHGDIEIDLLGHTAKYDGQALELTNREYALLEVFMQNPGRTLSRTLIAEKIWSSNFDVDTNLLDVYMSRLRSKLEKPGQNLFKTVRGVGYQLI
jgi:DNA-binding response OmpR family regulator